MKEVVDSLITCAIIRTQDEEICMFRKLLAPILLRFKHTQDLIAALDFLKLPRLQPGEDDSLIAEVKFAQLAMGRELIRRGVVFWA
jgi:hypothetical protein